MKDLLVIIPSRSRPQNIKRLISIWTLLTHDADLIFGLDTDDPLLAECQFPYEQWGELGQPTSIRYAINARIGMAGTLNYLANKFADQYFAIGFMGDDHIPRTVGWDVRIVRELKAMGTGIVYGNDLWQKENLPTAVFMTSNIISTLGYMCPPKQ
jgi:hypothetical protein